MVIVDEKLDPLWHVVNIDFKEQVNIGDKITFYEQDFPTAQITDTEEYLNQTLGTMIQQLKLITLFANLIALVMAVLITGLFVKMMVIKNQREIAVLMSIGFNKQSIIKQYMVRILCSLMFAIFIGVILVITLGEKIIGVVGSVIGASSIEFNVNVWVSYLFLPVVLIVVVLTTNYIILKNHRTKSISKMIIE